MSKFVIDIDGTICSQNKDGNYQYARPKTGRIETINKLYDEGHTIVLFTARGTETKIDWKEKTLEQLKKWEVKYHKIIFGKPSADFYLDDKNMEVWWLDNYKTLNEVLPLLEAQKK